jgi:hypothetical protein
VLDIVVHQNIRVSNIIVSDILDSVHLPIIFQIQDHVKFRNVLEPIEIFTEWERFQSLASECTSISQRIEINSGIEADKAARDFAASNSSAYLHSGWWSPNWVHSARRPFTGLLYLPRVLVRMENLVE